MKSIRPYAILLAGTFAALTAGQIQAQSYATPLEKLSISGTYYVQGAANGAGTADAAPQKKSISTSTLLKQAVADEFANGNENFTSATPPAGAAIYFNGTGFEIDKGTNQLADLTGDNIFTYAVSGQNDIHSGTLSGATAPYNQTDYVIATITYTSPSANTSNPLTFTVTGLATVTSKASTPNGRTGNLTVSGSVNFSSGTGEGTSSSTPIVITGVSINGSGSVGANNGNGTAENGD